MAPPRRAACRDVLKAAAEAADTKVKVIAVMAEASTAKEAM